MFLFIAYSCFLTFPLFAQLAEDNHPPKEDAWGNPKVNLYVSATIDTLYYDNLEPGVAYLSGTIEMVNYDAKESYNYDGDLRLDINPSRDDQHAPSPDKKILFSGKLKVGEIFRKTFYASRHVDATGTTRGDWWKLQGTLTIRLPKDQTWSANYVNPDPFLHDPVSARGIGPTKNGEDFSTDFNARAGEEWKSLLVTDAPYDEVLWWIQAPGDAGPGTNVAVDGGGDGNLIRATMSYTFPENIVGVYTIKAEICRNDGSGYERSYDVWVGD